MRPNGNTRDRLRLIVSGGIGSGKSTVLRVLERLGAVVIEADRIGHEVLEPGGAAYESVAVRWPAAVVEGRIDRQLLAAVVFSDGEQLALLESMTHPAIRDEIAVRVARSWDRDIALELPLHSELAGPGWTRLVIDAPTELRAKRSVARGMAEEDVARRLALQPDRKQWLAGADYVVANAGSLADLEAAIEQLWQRMKQPEE